MSSLVSWVSWAGGGMPEVGVEPTRPQGAGDFESPASAIPPLRHGVGKEYGRGSLPGCQPGTLKRPFEEMG